MDRIQTGVAVLAACILPVAGSLLGCPTQMPVRELCPTPSPAVVAERSVEAATDRTSSRDLRTVPPWCAADAVSVVAESWIPLGIPVVVVEPEQPRWPTDVPPLRLRDSTRCPDAPALGRDEPPFVPYLEMELRSLERSLSGCVTELGADCCTDYARRAGLLVTLHREESHKAERFVEEASEMHAEGDAWGACLDRRARDSAREAARLRDLALAAAEEAVARCRDADELGDPWLWGAVTMDAASLLPFISDPVRRSVMINVAFLAFEMGLLHGICQPYVARLVLVDLLLWEVGDPEKALTEIDLAMTELQVVPGEAVWAGFSALDVQWRLEEDWPQAQPILLYQRGLALVALDRPDEAVAAFEEASRTGGALVHCFPNALDAMATEALDALRTRAGDAEAGAGTSAAPHPTRPAP